MALKCPWMSSHSCAIRIVPTDQEMKESWSAPGDPAVLRREFDGWDPRIGQVLQKVGMSGNSGIPPGGNS